MVVDADGPYAALTTPLQLARKGGVQQKRRCFACAPVGAVDTITSNGKCEAGHGNAHSSVGRHSSAVFSLGLPRVGDFTGRSSAARKCSRRKAHSLFAVLGIGFMTEVTSGQAQG